MNFIVLLSGFALGQSYGVLFAARAVQGIGSACASVSAMALLADRYEDDEERTKHMAFGMGGLALGVLSKLPYVHVLANYNMLYYP